MTRKDYIIDEEGYYRFPNSGTLVHRWIAEKYVVRRKLEPNEVVHHKNGNKLDNRPKNLKVMTWEQHEAIHRNYNIYRFVQGLLNLVVQFFLLLPRLFMLALHGGKRRRRKRLF